MRTSPEGRDSRLGAEQRSLRCAQPRTQGCPILLCAPSPPAFPSSPVLSRVLRRVSASLPEQPYEDKISDRMLVNFTELLATALPRCSSAE